MIEASQILCQGLVISLCVISVWATMWGGMIFGFIRKWGESYLFENERKMAFDCPICMVPYYGTIFYLMLFVSWSDGWLLGVSSYIGTIAVAMGINAVIVKLLPENWYNE